MATCTECRCTWSAPKAEHCTVCHETFGGTYAGDRHRVGSFTDPGDPRRCLHPAEIGLRLNSRGHWSQIVNRRRLPSEL